MFQTKTAMKDPADVKTDAKTGDKAINDAIASAKWSTVLGQHSIAIAISTYDEAIKFNPRSAILYHNRGCNHFLAGNMYQALSDLEYASELEPNDPYAYINRALLYIHESRYARAWCELDKAPAVGCVRYFQAYLCHRTGLTSKVAEYLAMASTLECPPDLTKDHFKKMTDATPETRIIWLQSAKVIGITRTSMSDLIIPSRNKAVSAQQAPPAVAQIPSSFTPSPSSMS